MPSSTNQTKGAKPGSDYQCRATQLTPRFELLFDGEPCFMDIEFQKYRYQGIAREHNRVGRIAILNSNGDTVLDVYAIYPNETGIEKRWQPPEYGVIWQDLLFANGGVQAAMVEAWVADIIKNRTVVLHGGTNDLTAFYYQRNIFATSTVVNTQHLYGQIKLRTLASTHLGMTIQHGVHSPVDDADATRELYLLRRPYDRAAELAKIKAQTTASQPATTQPATTQPATTQPATTQPATTQPATTQPATTQPATTQPATSQPTTTTTTHPQNAKNAQTSRNLSGSAKRRNRKRAAAQKNGAQ